jgi:hypothetical protein
MACSRRVRALAGLAVLLAACDGDPPPRAHTHDPSPPTAAIESPHATSVTEVADRAPATLLHATGSVRVDAAPGADGATLERGQRLVLEDGAEASLELAEGDRVTLFGPSTARVGEEGSAAIEIGRGTAHVRLPPGPAGPRGPLRLATPEGSVELIGPAEVFIDADRSGATWFVVMSGLARLGNGDADARHHARLTDLQGGQAVVVAEQPAEPTAAPVRLDQARAAAAMVFGMTPPLEAPRLADRARRAATELDAAFGWLETEARHGHDLTDEHRAAVAAGQSDEAMRLQGALVGHAQELHALRDTARLRWCRLAALVLAGAVPVGEADPSAARRDRAASLLGLE